VRISVLGGDFFRKQPAHPSVMKLFLGGATGSGSGRAFGVVVTDSVSGKLRIKMVHAYYI